MTFEDLNINTPLLNALNDLEYMNPTPIQEKAFPVIMSGKDVVGIAQTGTGKTFAYLLPILRQLKYSEQKHPRVLIIVPTRELVIQIVGEITKLSKYMTLRYEGVYGGTNISTQKQSVYDGIDILVATPGRLYDLAMSGILRLKFIQKLVIDEVDQLFNLGFRPQLMSFMETLPRKRQNLLFSATLNQDVENLINDWLSDPQKIEITAHGTPLEKIIQLGYNVPNFNTKVNLLENLLNKDNTIEKVLVFSSSKKMADKLHDQIEKKFPNHSGSIHSNKSQSQRINTLKKFQDGKLRILIATDIAARGLNISDVTHVINFDTPEIPEDYIHRIGRTGRANKAGTAITFINEVEENHLLNIEEMMNKRITILPMDESVEISTIFLENEKPNKLDKNYFKFIPEMTSKGAFQEKLEKNKKVNVRIGRVESYKGKPSNRSAEKRKKKK